MPPFLVPLGLFFKGISLKTWLTLGLVGLLLVGTLLVKRKVDNHFKAVAQLEADKAKAQRDADRFQDALKIVASINEQNQRGAQLKINQERAAREIAELELVAAQNRELDYRKIRDAAKSTPSANRRPVSPVVRDTIDRMYRNRSQ